MKDKIRNIVKKSYNLLKENNVNSLPIDVEALAQKLDIKIDKQNLEDNLSGFFVRKEGRNVIGLNENHSEVRKRFTIAHEIGHFNLHSEQPLFIDYYQEKIYRRNKNTNDDYEIEREANIFAANLLMPEHLISQQIDNLPDNLSYVEQVNCLTKVFNVSKQAMDIRLKSLGYFEYNY
ncbi:ImmA/IrrE family metallo-endopeptidase [Wenyingzhuangia sp. IMCC45533]